MCDNKAPKKRNFVAKYIRRFNKGGPHRDRTKYIRREKYKKKDGEDKET